MIAHTIVYVILSILSVTAASAAGMPVNKPSQEQVEPVEEEKDTPNSL